MTHVTEAELRALYDYEATGSLVKGSLEAASESLESLLRFAGRFAWWNGFFGAGVASLSGKVARSRQLFLDTSEPILSLADRSVLVASFFFDAARDEFDDRDTAHRDTHRCLAQALLAGLLAFAKTTGDPGLQKRLASPEHINTLWEVPPWLTSLRERVRQGYGGASPDDLLSIFRAFGYHLGSEVLADKEFSVLDATLREQQPALVTALCAMKVRVADEEHNAYQWLRIHSGHGGGAEADHFAWAVRGVEYAFRYVPASAEAPLREQLHLGFLDFSRDHRLFFEKVNS